MHMRRKKRKEASRQRKPNTAKQKSRHTKNNSIKQNRIIVALCGVACGSSPVLVRLTIHTGAGSPKANKCPATQTPLPDDNDASHETTMTSSAGLFSLQENRNSTMGAQRMPMPQCQEQSPSQGIVTTLCVRPGRVCVCHAGCCVACLHFASVLLGQFVAE